MPKHKSLYSLATHYRLEILVEAIRVDLFSCFKAVSMQIKDAQVILLVLLDWFVQNNVGKHLLVAYWGQNSSGNDFPNNPEKELKDVCAKRKYDIIVIGFVVTFFGKNNKDEMPEVNFSGHCWEPASPQLPNLYRCPNIEEGIKACQQMGKKVLISLGGATGKNDLTDEKAKVLAKNLWDLFLGGKERSDIRPFGSAILDGIDLDIEDAKSEGYAQLVKSLRDLEDGSKKYLITGAPQCVYPDASLGPSEGTALTDQGAQFDHVHVQFYNNFCHTGDQAQFYPTMDKWLQFAFDATRGMILKRTAEVFGPKIFVGMPSHPGGSGDPKYYRTPQEVAAIYEKLKDKPNFGGFMLWDASWDQQNVIQGKVYSDHIADIISESGNSGKPTGVPTTATPGYTPTSDGSITPGGTLPPTTPGGSPPPTAGGSTPSTLPVVPTSPPSPGGGDGLDFCKGKEDGDYGDPDNPSGYISCSGGVTHKRKCPQGFVWNEEGKYCDWPKKLKSNTRGNQRPFYLKALKHPANVIQVLKKRTNEGRVGRGRKLNEWKNTRNTE